MQLRVRSKISLPCHRPSYSARVLTASFNSKFVDSHLKPYHCKVPSCENARFSSTACLLRHEREAHAMHGHGDKPHMCTYKGCERSLPGNGFPRHWNLRDHMRRVHNDNGPQIQSGAGSSPPPAGAAQAPSSRGRKRKSESSEAKPGRKSSSKPTPATEGQSVSTPKATVPVITARQEWHEHQQALANLVQGSYRPDDSNVFQYYAEAQRHLQAMSSISTGLIPTHKPDPLNRWQRTCSQQTG